MEKSGGTIMTPTARDVWGGRTEEFVFDEVAQHLRPRVGFCIRTLDVVSVGVSANPRALWRRSPTFIALVTQPERMGEVLHSRFPESDERV
jgi:hypothetical protein